MKYEDLSHSVELIGCSELIDHISIAFPGWRIVETSANDQPPVISLQRKDEVYILQQADWFQKPVRRNADKIAIICSLVARLVSLYVRDSKNILCLHCAAAEFGGKLIVFPSKFRAGKSVISACIAAAGITLFCDDVLPVSISDGRGIALELAPRLRLPLPDSLAKETRQFIEYRTAFKGKKYIHLDLRGDILAKRGQRLPIGAFVLLEREEGIAPVLEAVSEAETLRHVVWQNFARKAEAPNILDRLNQMVAKSGRYHLRYDSAEDAVALLKETFQNHAENEKNTISASVLSTDQSEGPHLNDAPPGSYLRKAGISMLALEGESFLADADGATIHHLNPVGSAIWTVLSHPTTLNEVVELLLVAFPEENREKIENDVGILIDELKARNLIIEGFRSVT